MAKDDFKFKRGEYLSDLVTGFCGVVTSRCDHITSCNSYFLKPSVDKDGKDQDGHWFDEHSLEYDPKHLGEKISLERAQEQPPG
jgi:hypothetical protein